ncbi:hypothetical protein [Nitrosophilus kaiyonis]|uniref:hypothetical protein n=1 Tax=Nitrosophilus kaiyonis TaxID=2930200 RepID=UPI0024902C7C|nr:hypothetical protein [Nitrosophilus kaiyonis]
MFEYIFYLIIFSAILTYIVWGFIISFESMLALNDTKSAIDWIKKHHKPNTYKTLLIIFLPMLHLGYIFLELIPYFLGINKKLRSFDLEKLYKKIFYKNEKQ